MSVRLNEQSEQAKEHTVFAKFIFPLYSTVSFTYKLYIHHVCTMHIHVLRAVSFPSRSMKLYENLFARVQLNFKPINTVFDYLGERMKPFESFVNRRNVWCCSNTNVYSSIYTIIYRQGHSSLQASYLFTTTSLLASSQLSFYNDVTE